jgi:putative membrane protein
VIVGAKQSGEGLEIRGEMNRASARQLGARRADGWAFKRSPPMIKTMSRMVLGMSLSAMMLLAGRASAADAPATADVLAKLHESNQKEIAMGKMAEKNGTSKDVIKYGKMLVKDHSAADKKVVALAKKEKLTLPTPPEAKHDDMGAKGPAFDSKFAKDMVDDHKKDVAEATTARDNTTDEQLKKLLTELVPTLQKHQDAAQKIVDEGDAKAAK